MEQDTVWTQRSPCMAHCGKSCQSCLQSQKLHRFAPERQAASPAARSPSITGELLGNPRHKPIEILSPEPKA
jgi:hypothetical protein